MTAHEKLHLAILKILARSNLKLFGCLIYKFDIRIIQTQNESMTAHCFFDSVAKKPVMEFSERFMNEDIKDVGEAIYVIIHEMLHIIDGHNSRSRYINKNEKIFGLACDHDVNCKIDKDINNTETGFKEIINAPSHRFFIRDLVNQDLTVYEIYEYLMNIRNNIKFEPFFEDGTTGEQIDGEEIEKLEKPPVGANVHINEKYQGKIYFDLKPEAEGVGEACSDELKAEVRSIINNILSKGQYKGCNKGAIAEFLNKISELKIPWEILLENVIQTTRVKSNTNKSWKNIRKKFRHLNVKLPDSSKDVIKDSLYVLLDTSGSMSTLDQEKFANLILQSINYFKSIKVIQHDYTVQNVLELTRDTFENQKDEIFKIYGRGGTSHIDCFKYVEQQFFEEDEAIGLIILATDYQSDIEHIWNDFNFHKFIPVKVLCTSANEKISSMVDTRPVYC